MEDPLTNLLLLPIAGFLLIKAWDFSGVDMSVAAKFFLEYCSVWVADCVDLDYAIR